MEFFVRKYSIFTAVIMIAVVMAACGPATPSAEDVNEATGEGSLGEESLSDESQANELPADEIEDETETEDEPGLEGSFDIYGGKDEADFSETDSGLKYIVFEEGDGPVPELGQVVSVHYTGWLTNGTPFDSSVERGQPFSFPLGQGAVIAGWDEGIGLLSEGSSGRLIIPPELAYGESGAGAQIPPGATLVFDVELVEILPPPPEAPTTVDEDDFALTDSGVKYFDFDDGSGAAAEDGQIVTVHYTGWLDNGSMFDSSFLRGQPISVLIGAGQVIPGWEEGLLGLKVGGKRQIIIPPEMAYGEDGAGGGIIPPNATLIFEVELLDVTPPQ